MSTESAIISSYPTSMCGIIVLLNTNSQDKNISELYLLTTRVFSHFERKFYVTKLSVSIFGQTTGYKIYTVSREPIRLPEFNIQYLVFLK